MGRHLATIVTEAPLSSPALGVDAGDRMLQSIDHRDVGCLIARYRRAGTLWEGRSTSALVDSDHDVIACYRYIELNPGMRRNGMTPLRYRWSSDRHNAFGIGHQRSHPIPPTSRQIPPPRNDSKLTGIYSTKACPATTRTRRASPATSRNPGATKDFCCRSRRSPSASWKFGHAATQGSRKNVPDRVVAFSLHPAE